MIYEKLNEVEKNICEACKKANRNREEVTLIAVSKTKPVEILKEVYDLEIRNFGENKVQELIDKQKELPLDIKWHMIGHLQTNKVSKIIDKVILFHSVDSIHLAEIIEKEASKKGIIANILLEVNVGEEDSKYGFKIDDVICVIESISDFSHIKIKGLMTVAPFTENPEDNRIIFRNLKKLFDDIKEKNIDNVDMSVLSMGMTNDYMVAIEEGATMIRVGTGIFGERNYNK